MIGLAIALVSGWFAIVILLVGSFAFFLSIAIVGGQWKDRGAFVRLMQPRQWAIVAGEMHREPVYPGEDEPVQYEEGDQVGTPVA